MIPKMILFDYGQTLFHQNGYNSRDGYEAMMKYITVNPQKISPETVTALASKIYKQCGDILGFKKKRDWHLEVPQTQIIHYIMEYYGLGSERSEEELSVIYWDAACNGTAVHHVDKMLLAMEQQSIMWTRCCNIYITAEFVRVWSVTLHILERH